jgi:hypothetical protein
VLAVGQDHAGKRHLIHGADGLANDGIGVMPDLAVRDDVIGPHQIQIVDLVARYELVDVDGSRGFQSNVVEFISGNFEVLVLIDLIPLDDVLVRHLFAGIGVDLKIADAVTC